MLEPLSLAHQTLIEEKCKKLGLSLSEYSFANLYLFRKVHNYHLVKEEDFFFIQGKTYDEHTFLMPLFVPTQESIHSWRNHLPPYDFFFPIQEKWLELFPNASSTCNDADSDYLYSVEQLASYAGRHLSGKRNLVRQFLDRYTSKTAPLTSSSRNDALQTINDWQTQTQEPKEKTDFYPSIEAVELFDRLHLQGVIYYVDGAPKGVVVGEALSQDTFLIHFVKADNHSKGLYQFIYQDFAQKHLQSFTWVNMEQDLGKEELRQSKHSYQPVSLIKKYRIKIALIKINYL